MLFPPSLVVISGASRGIGLAFAQQLLQRSGDTTVIAASRSGSEAPALRQLQLDFPGRVAPMACDVTNAGDCKTLAAQVKADYDQPVDLLLNVAGVLHEAGTSGYMPERSLAQVDADRMAQVFATNAIGPVLMTQAFAPQFRKGSVVGNLSARVGSISDNGLGGWWSYRMSKAALNMATVNMSIELKRKGAIAIALHPGTTDTGLSEPFQKNVKPEKLFTPQYSAGSMLDVIEGLKPEDTGRFFAYDGSPIEY